MSLQAFVLIVQLGTITPEARCGSKWYQDIKIPHACWWGQKFTPTDELVAAKFPNEKQCTDALIKINFGGESAQCRPDDGKSPVGKTRHLAGK